MASQSCGVFLLWMMAVLLNLVNILLTCVKYKPCYELTTKFVPVSHGQHVTGQHSDVDQVATGQKPWPLVRNIQFIPATILGMRSCIPSPNGKQFLSSLLAQCSIPSSGVTQSFGDLGLKPPAMVHISGYNLPSFLAPGVHVFWMSRMCPLTGVCVRENKRTHALCKHVIDSQLNIR